MTAEIIVSTFNEIGCHAFSPGSKDFAAGLSFVQELQMSANFPFISANIQDIQGNRLFDPYAIIDIDEISLGVIGLASNFTHPDIFSPDPMLIHQPDSSRTWTAPHRSRRTVGVNNCITECCKNHGREP